MINQFFHKFKLRFKKENTSFEEIKLLLGFKPNNISLYIKAFTPNTTDDNNQNYERLEFLGDSILGSIIADYLFKKYPNNEEGFLTEMRCKIVNRKKLNEVGNQLKLKSIVSIVHKNNTQFSNIQFNILGDIVEALIGAIFLDKGYEFTDNWVHKNILKPYIKLNEIEKIDANIKNTLFAWAAKNNKIIDFKLEKELVENNRKTFFVQCLVNNEVIAEGIAFNKKDASIYATEKALKILKIQEL